MSVTVSPPERKDRLVWGEIWTGYLDFYGTALAPSAYDVTFGRFFDTGPFEPRCLLAWHQGECIGLIHYFRHRHCWRPEDVVYVQDLFVAPPARGTGSGRALIEAVYTIADQQGTPTVYWMTESNNDTAMRLYDQIAHRTSFIKYQR